MKTPMKFVVMVVVVIALLTIAAPTFAAPGATFDSFVQTGCTIAITFTVEDAGTYYIIIYDDGNTIFTQGVAATAGSTNTVNFNITAPPGPIFPGFGIDINSQSDGFGTSFDYRDPVDVIYPCAAASSAEACISFITSGSVQGRLESTTQTYYDPSLDASTNFSLPVGTSWWIVDAEDGFYKLFIACQADYVWAPAEAFGPNFDPVWSGRLLPSSNSGS